jgi:hypothetical protein
MGIDEPARVVSTGIVFIGIGGGLLYIAGLGLAAIIDKICTNVAELQRVNWDGRATVKRLELQAATTGAIGARALDSDYGLARVCLYVLQAAYSLDRPYQANEARPWVRDNAWALAQANNVAGMGQVQCTAVRSWLLENDLIKDNQLNRAKYPSFEDARRHVDQVAAPPLVINSPTPPYQEQTSIIKNL